MTIKIEQVPQALGDALERKAAQEGRSVGEIAMEAMAKGLGIGARPPGKRDLSRYRGKWVEDPAFDEAIKQFDTIDEELWR